MNYQRIYLCIVLRAQREYDERKANKKNNGAYYEVHHILPRSLNGTNDKANLAMLTAREHFICHWLLVKIYPNGSMARDKMLSALWRMSGSSGIQVGHRYTNSRVYAVLRKEFQLVNSKRMKVSQTGENNSQFGWHWYTNAYTGETTKFGNEPKYPWVPGRNLFHGESNRLPAKLGHNIAFAPKQPSSTLKAHKTSIFAIVSDAKRQTEQLWDNFHNSDASSIADFSERLHLSSNAVRKRFKKHIPLFSYSHVYYRWIPNKMLIGVYAD